jgi:hypothetical protein
LCRRPRRYKSEINPKKTENAGTDHCNPSTKKVVTEIARSDRIPTTVKKGCAQRRMGKLDNRSTVMALRKRRCVFKITSHTKSIPATAVP